MNVLVTLRVGCECVREYDDVSLCVAVIVRSSDPDDVLLSVGVLVFPLLWAVKISMLSAKSVR